MKAYSLLLALILIISILFSLAGCGDNGSADSSAIEVDYSNPPKLVTPEKSMLIMGVGETYTLKAFYDSSKPAGGLKYSSDNPKAVTVEASTGKLTAKAEGYAKVTVTSFNGLNTYSYVTVKKQLSGLSFINNSVNMLMGEKTEFQLVPAKTDQGLAGADLKSSDDSIVSIDDKGVVSAVSVGNATITATSFNGKKAVMNITVITDKALSDKTTSAPTTVQKDASWSSDIVCDLPAGSTVKKYGSSDDGRWLKVKYNDKCGWVYNKAFGETNSYSEYSLKTLPLMDDDLIFDVGKDKRKIFDFVYNISYEISENDDTTENLCVDYFKYARGSCYHHGAMLCYLYNRCGWETVRLVGVSAYDGVSTHSWCMSKTPEGWKHVDAQYFSIRSADDQFFIDDYSKFFKWDKSQYPPSSAASGDSKKTDTTQ